MTAYTLLYQLFGPSVHAADELKEVNPSWISFLLPRVIH